MPHALVPALAPALALAALLAGCATPLDSAAPSPGGAAASPPASPASEAVPLRLEQAERSLDLGRDAPATGAVLEQTLADPSLTQDQRDQARLSLSRAREQSGDHEGALGAVEAVLADHPDRQAWPGAEAAEARLRRLLTGSDEGPARMLSDDGRPAPPFARALAAYFPAPADKTRPLELSVILLGASSDDGARLGTFDVASALHAARREACSLCEDTLSVHTRRSSYSSWTALPAVRKELGRALSVFYFHLEDPIPARYDAELPLPSAEIVARLERGEGLFAARERPGAPPVVLVAAPRPAQLAEVEEALSLARALPAAPVAVPLKATLKPKEIQAVVRGSFGAYRGCYEAAQKDAPDAAGTATLRFSIGGDGAVSGLSVEVSEGALRAPAFEACVKAATAALVFPSTRAPTPTTVTYPISFSPGG